MLNLFSHERLTEIRRFAAALVCALAFSAGAVMAQEVAPPQPSPAPSPAEPRQADPEPPPPPAQDEPTPVAEPAPPQEPAPPPAPEETRAEPAAPPVAPAPPAAPAAPEPAFREYRGVRIGMARAEVRQRLGNPSETVTGEDFFAFSENHRARVLYGSEGRVTALVVTYIGAQSNAPSPRDVLGVEVEANQDGSLHRLERYPQAGYWVSYSRTSGDAPLIIITMQQMDTPTP